MAARCLALAAALTAACACADPTPPCAPNPPVPNAAVAESWCSTVLAENAASGVTVASYGAPAAETLVSISAEQDLFFGFPLFEATLPAIFEYFAGRNSLNASFIAQGRTTPISIRPPRVVGQPWNVSMMVSTALFPDASKLPAPTSPVRLEPVGARTLAALQFRVNASEYIAFDSPPFPFFLECGERLAAGLPAGWKIDAASEWTPAWLLYNNQSFRGVWTAACLAEVAPTNEGGPRPLPPHNNDGPGLLKPRESSGAAARELARTHLRDKLVADTALALRSLPAPPHGAAFSDAAAPDVCGALLEFEDVHWGAWTPPHAPNVPTPDINGGTDGLNARGAGDTMFVTTSTDTPSFGLHLIALNTTSGKTSPVGPKNYPLAPAGFAGAGGNPISVNFHLSLGLVVGMTEVSLYGPYPPPCFPGWTTVAAVDPATGAGEPLTSDVTPLLAALPNIFSGVSALDPARSVLWLVGDAASVLPGASCPAPPVFPPFPPSSGSAIVDAAPAAPPPPVLIGIKLSTSPPSPPSALLVIPLMDQGTHAVSIEYASAVDAIISAEYNVSNLWAPPGVPGEIFINMYPLSGPNAGSVVTLGVFPGGPAGVSPTVGQSEVSADGRFVYFGAEQASAEFESSALIVIDTVAKTFVVNKAAPTDDYDIIALGRCEGY